MAWTNLKTTFKDLVWSGKKKYNLVNNEDGTVSLDDVTQYTNKEDSVFGAKEVNQICDAVNGIMEAPISLDRGGTGTDMSTVPPNALIRMNGQGAKNFWYTKVKKGACYATSEDGYPEFGMLPSELIGIQGKFSNNKNKSFCEIGDLLVCWGYDSITPSEPRQGTGTTISFPAQFAVPPTVFLTVRGTPAIDVLTLTCNDVWTHSFEAYIFANNVTPRGFNWLAIGKKA